MVTERTIINALIIGASFILAPFIISSSLSADYYPALIFGMLTAFIFAVFVLKETLSVWPFLAGAISGSLNFLPIPLKATQVFCILLIVYYITGYVILRQKRVKLGRPQFLWPIMIITLIVFYHNHNLHIRALGGGGETEGGKPAILIFMTVIAYFCGINIVKPSVDFLSNIPLYSVILTLVSNIPFFLTTYFPGLAPYVYYITDNVNVGAYSSSVSNVTGDIGGISRMLVFAPVAGTLQLYLICKYPIATWLRPGRWWVIAASLACFFMEIETGFRTVLLGYILMFVVGTLAHYAGRALLILMVPLFACIVVAFATLNNLLPWQLNKLPLSAQRTLSFLPGNWDSDAVLTADASNDFRNSIYQVYVKEYLYNSPLIGNGFDIDTQKYEGLSDYIQTNNLTVEESRYYTGKMFIEGKLFHTGWISLYDAVGLIGGAAFVVLGLNQIRASAHFIFGPKADHRSTLFPLYIWIFIGAVSQMVIFFLAFGDFKESFIGMCVAGILLSQLHDIENTTETSNVPTLQKATGSSPAFKESDYSY